MKYASGGMAVKIIFSFVTLNLYSSRKKSRTERIGATTWVRMFERVHASKFSLYANGAKRVQYTIPVMVMECGPSFFLFLLISNH